MYDGNFNNEEYCISSDSHILEMTENEICRVITMTSIIKCYQHCFLITHSVKFHYAIEVIYMLGAPCGVYIHWVFESCPIVISYLCLESWTLNPYIHEAHVPHWCMSNSQHHCSLLVMNVVSPPVIKSRQPQMCAVYQILDSYNTDNVQNTQGLPHLY